MTITTKELFELAEAQVVALGGQWDIIPPREQAELAESIRPVVEALEGMGFARGDQVTQNAFEALNEIDFSKCPLGTVFVRADDGPWKEGGVLAGGGGGGGTGPWVISHANGSNGTFFGNVAGAEVKGRIVRQWTDIRDVPHDVKIRDDDGDVLAWRDENHSETDRYLGAGWYIIESADDREGWAYDDSDEVNYTNEEFGPFVEVIDTPVEPQPEQWDNWRDVPDGVVYAPANGHDLIWKNVNGERLLSAGGGWGPSWNDDEEMAGLAPFVRAEIEE